MLVSEQDVAICTTKDGLWLSNFVTQSLKDLTGDPLASGSSEEPGAWAPIEPRAALS